MTMVLQFTGKGGMIFWHGNRFYVNDIGLSDRSGKVYGIEEIKLGLSAVGLKTIIKIV